MPRGRRSARGRRKREGDERNKTSGEGKKRCTETERGRRSVWGTARGTRDNGSDEGKKGGRRGEGIRVAAGRERERDVISGSCGAVRRSARGNTKKPGMHFRVPPTITVDRSNLVVTIGSERRRERSGTREADRHAPRIRRRSGVGLPTSRHSPVPWTVLYLLLSMTLYTGPFRPLSVRRNTVFYQLRRAPITGKL